MNSCAFIVHPFIWLDSKRQKSKRVTMTAKPADARVLRAGEIWVADESTAANPAMDSNLSLIVDCPATACMHLP